MALLFVCEQRSIERGLRVCVGGSGRGGRPKEAQNLRSKLRMLFQYEGRKMMDYVLKGFHNPVSKLSPDSQPKSISTLL